MNIFSARFGKAFLMSAAFLFAASSFSTLAQAATTYTVHSGDSLWAIAQRYDISVTALESANHLQSSLIHPGQLLTLPDGSVAQSSSTDTPLSGRGGGPTYLSSAALLGESIALSAEKLVGTPYQWGGTSPAGFDCSGFVQYVYGQLGVHLPRTSYDMYNVSHPVSLSNAQVGNLIFFNADGPGASHVGIYLGDGHFIDAESDGVRISSVNAGYWNSHLLGVRAVS
ncbi:LysM peptidoglycan-binding domain-containing protein [Alicyclobacillaceae bacterium I2511]|nr:LysM peptidoglycan-binding domain-containing protein [Alicyclobacillaceae bacterium I2511]